MNLHLPVNENDQKQGNIYAPLVMVEYGDYECPHCGAAYPIVKKLQRHFEDRLLFVFRNFPLTEMHPHALAAARMAEAAAQQKKFWEAHDLIFEHQSNLSSGQLLSMAKEAGTDVKKLVADMNSIKIITKVDSDIESGVRSGVNGTPTFFINGKRHDSYYDFDVLKDALERKLEYILKR
jgi:protein-disulfide isomerase